MKTEFARAALQRTRQLAIPGCACIVLAGLLFVLITSDDEIPQLTIAVKQGVESVALKELAQSFSRETHIRVQVLELPYDQLYLEEQRQLKQRPQRVRDSTPPFDVIMIDDPWLYALVSDPSGTDGRRLTPLKKYLEADGSDFFSSVLRVASFCPKHDDCRDYYAVPIVANSQLFAYRAADFQHESVPTTWQAVAKAAARIEKKDHIGYVTRIGPGNSIVTDFMPILWAYDPDSLPFFAESKQPLVQPRAAIEMLDQLVATRKNLGSASFDDFDVSAYLEEERASMGIVWSAWAMMLVDIDEKMRQAQLTALVLDAPKAEKLVFTSIPQGSNSESQAELGTWLLAIPINSEQQSSALEFIQYVADLGEYSNPNHPHSLLAARRGTPPPRQSVLSELERDTKFRDRHPSLIPAIRWSLEWSPEPKGVNHSRARPRSACWKEIESQLGGYLEKSIDQEIVAKDIQSKANANLSLLFDDQTCREFLHSQNAYLPRTGLGLVTGRAANDVH
ncbi:MAG TPA: extracellular solute-binding protein [Terriglobales bacterium]|nr:extracellular solute-binding protein [Terriglobales bacterium]